MCAIHQTVQIKWVWDKNKMSKQAVQHNTEVQVDKMSASPDMLIRQSKQNGYEWKNKMSKQAVSAGLMK